MIVLNKRAAGLGMAGALALGTVVSAGALAPASADGSAVNYSCQTTLRVDPYVLPVTGSATLPTTVESGQSLKGLPVSMSVTLPADLVSGLMAGLGATALGGSSSDVAFPLVPSAGGDAVASVPLAAFSIPTTTATQGQPLALQGTGNTGAARAPLPGTYNVGMPGSFHFTPVTDNLGPLPPVPCTTDTPSALGVLKVVKAVSTTTAKVANLPATTTKHAKIPTSVKAAGFAAKGTVVAKEGTKTLKSATLKAGKATLVLPLLKKGAHTIKVIYKGNAANKASSKTLSFTVKRG